MFHFPFRVQFTNVIICCIKVGKFRSTQSSIRYRLDKDSCRKNILLIPGLFVQRLLFAQMISVKQ